MTDIYRKGFIGTLYIYLGKFGSQALVFLISIYVIKQLSVSEYGLFKTLTHTGSLIAIFSSFGIPWAIRRYLPEYFEGGNYWAIKKILSFGLILRFLGSSLIIIICLIFIDAIATFLNVSSLKEYFPIYSIAVIVMVSNKTIESALNSLLRQKFNNLAKLVYAILQFGLFFGALKLGYGVSGLIICILILNSILFCIYFWGIKNLILIKVTNKNKESIFRRVTRYSLFNYFNDVTFSFFEISIDIYIISHFLGTEAVAFYAFAAGLSRKITDLIPIKVAWTTVIMPIFVQVYTKDKDKQKLCNLFSFAQKILAFFAFPIIMGALLLGDKIIEYVYDPKYLDAIAAFLIIIVLGMISRFFLNIGMIALTLEKPEIILYGRIFSAYNFIMDIALIQFWGIVGVAIATGSAWLLRGMTFYIFIRKHIQIKFPWKSFLRMLINSLIMGTIVFFMRSFIMNLGMLLLTLSAGVLIYLIASYKNAIFDSDERDILNKMIGKRIFKS